jgi:glycosyltransferase involved in cell wall biosynthesis
VLVATRGVVPIAVGCGGAEVVAYELARAAAAAGHEVVLLSDVSDAEVAHLPRLRYVPVGGRLQRRLQRMRGGFFRWLVQHLVGNLSVARAARRELRSSQFDVVHTHGSLATILISWRTRVPIVYTEHDSTPWSCHYRRWWERAIRKVVYRTVNGAAYSRATCVAATCGSLAAEIVRRWHVDPRRVTTILGAAIDANVFHAKPTEPSLASTVFGVERYCLFAGRLTPRKAPDLLLHALVEAPEVTCVFAGDGPMRSRLERLAETLGVAERALFLGSVGQADMPALYAAADFVVMPSFSETTSMVAVEAMACGTPVIATRIAELPNLVTDWERGFLIKPGDVGQLAMALRFVDGDADLRARMSKNAQHFVSELLSPTVSERYLELYASLRASQPVESPALAGVPA